MVVELRDGRPVKAGGPPPASNGQAPPPARPDPPTGELALMEQSIGGLEEQVRRMGAGRPPELPEVDRLAREVAQVQVILADHGRRVARLERCLAELVSRA